jgi:hypothetical protein
VTTPGPFATTPRPVDLQLRIGGGGGIEGGGGVLAGVGRLVTEADRSNGTYFGVGAGVVGALRTGVVSTTRYTLGGSLLGRLSRMNPHEDGGVVSFAAGGSA